MEIKRRKQKGLNLAKKYDKKVSESKGVSHDSLLKSRHIRGEFLSKYGFIPSSILVHNPSDQAVDLARGYMHVRAARKKYIAKKAPLLSDSAMTMRGYTMTRDGSGMEGQEYGSAVLSKFTQNIGKFMVKFYCPDGGIVYDPFAGHNSRMQLCFESGCDYYGCDVSEEFMNYNRKVRKYLLGKAKNGLLTGGDSTPAIKLFHQSSHRVKQLKSNFADFTITSPPYWDIEYYGPEKEQLGFAKTYDKFVELLSRHAKENYRILKPGGFCCWFINDFIKKGTFHPYHIDTYRILCESGFTPFNIYILKLPSITMQFIQGTKRSRVLPKTHEYIVVVRK